MVSKNNLCSYSPITSIWTAKRIIGFAQGVIRVEPLNSSNPLKHSEHSKHSKHSNPVKHVEPFKRFKEIEFNALEWMGR